MSIADHNRHSIAYAPKEQRHFICIAFEQLLRQVVADQDTKKSNVAEALAHEFGTSVAHAIMMAADIQRLRMEHHGMNLHDGRTSDAGNPL